MSNQSLPWFRMYTDFLNDPKMIALAFEDQRHFIGILALKSDGALDQDCCPDLMDRIVAQRLWIDHAIIRDVKKRLIAAGLIDDFWQPLAWNKRQMRSDADPTNAERQRRYREKKKAEEEAGRREKELAEKAEIAAKEAKESAEKESNALRNAPVTQLDKIRVDTDKDIDILSSKPDDAPAKQPDSKDSPKPNDVGKRVIDYLNEKTGSKFGYAKSHLRLIVARIKDGATEGEIRQVVDRKHQEWANDKKMRQYLRPGTLFTPKNYDNYVGQLAQPLPANSKTKHSGFGQIDYRAGADEHGYF